MLQDVLMGQMEVEPGGESIAVKMWTMHVRGGVACNPRGISRQDVLPGY